MKFVSPLIVYCNSFLSNADPGADGGGGGGGGGSRPPPPLFDHAGLPLQMFNVVHSLNGFPSLYEILTLDPPPSNFFSWICP